MENFVLPELYCPFPSLLNPHYTAVQEHSSQWVSQFRLVQSEAAWQRFRSTDFAALAARAHPTARLADLAIACDWYVWLFLFDDQFDEGSIGKLPAQIEQVHTQVLAIIDRVADAIPLGPIGAALDEFWGRVMQCTTPAWRQRFRVDLIEYMHAYAWEAENRVHDQIPTVDMYIENRRRTGSLATSLDMIDITQRLTLSENILNSQELRHMWRHTSNVICWANDLYSLPKELARGDIHNLIIAIQQANSCSLQQAVEQVCVMIEQEVRSFLLIEQSLPHYSPAIDLEIQRYVQDLKSWMRGNYDWSIQTGRYSQVEYTAPGQPVSYIETILSI